MDFNVSFQKSVQELTELLIKLDQLGGILDTNELKSTKTGSRLVESLTKVVTEINKVTQAYENNSTAAAGSEQEAMRVAQVSQRVASIMETLGRAHTDSAVKVAGLKGEMGGLRDVLQETAAMRSYIKWQEREAALLTDLEGKERLLSQQFAVSKTTEAQRIAQLQAMLRAVEQMASAEQRLAGQLKITEQAINLGTTADGKALLIAREKLRNQEQLTVAEQRLVSQLDQSNSALNLMSTTEAKNLAVSKEKLRSAQELAAADERRNSSMLMLTNTLNYLNSAEAKQEAELRVKVAQQRRINEEDAKASLGLDNRTKATQRLSEAMAKEIAETRQLEAATKAANEAMIRSAMKDNYGGRPYTNSMNQTISLATGDATNAELRAQLSRNAVHGGQSASLRVDSVTSANSAARERQLAEAVKIRNDLTTAMANSQRTLTAEEAKTIVKTEQLTAAFERTNRAQIEAVKTAQGISAAQNSVANSIESESQRLAELRARRESLSGVEGRELRRIRELVAAEKERVASLESVARSTGTLATATNRLTFSMDGSAQAGAAFRATLAGMKSSFGSFAGSTLLVASGFFMLTSAIRATLGEGVEYQKSMSRINALTSGAGDTAQEAAVRMGRVQSAVRQQAIDSIYNARETAEGFQYLVQSGQNAETAIKSLPATLSMASVSMISMKEAADLTTNIMSSFNMKAGDMTHVVDVMTTAVTASNQTMQELGNALSYIGPSAASAGYSMQEITAAVMTLSNNGIKSSRAGTGLRGIITGLIEPSRDGVQVMKDLGIAIDDLDGKTRPLTEVMEQFKTKFKELNLTQTEQLAIINKLFGRYAQSAASVLINQNDVVEKFKAQLDDVEGAAQRSADKIRDNLHGAWENTSSAAEDVGLEVFEQLAPLLTTATMELNNFFLSMTNADIDRTVAKLTSVASTVAQMGTYWALLKVGGTAFTYLGTGVANVYTRLQSVNRETQGFVRNFERVRTTTLAGLQAVNNTAGTVTGSIRNNFLAVGQAISSTTTLTNALKISFQTLQVAIGWIGTALALGTAAYSMYTMWASNGKKEVQEFNNLIDAQIDKQNSLKKANDAAEATRKAEELNHEIERGTKMAKELEEQYKSLSEMQASGLGGEATKTALHEIAEKIMSVGGAIRAMRLELENLNKSGDTASTQAMTLGEIAAKRQATQHSYDEWLKRTYPDMDLEQAREKASHLAVGQTFRNDLSKYDKQYADVASKVNVSSGVNAKPEDRQKEFVAQLADIRKQEEEKANVVLSARQRRMQKEAELDKVTRDAEKAGASLTVRERARADYARLYPEIMQLKKEEAEEERSLQKAKRSAYNADLTITQLKSDLADIDRRIAEAKKAGDTPKLTQLYGERSQINSMISSKNKAGQKGAKQDAQEFKKAADTYNKMVESMDDGSLKAVRVFEERRNAIAKLFKEGTVGYTAAMYQARVAFERELAKTDQYYKDPKSLVKSYTGKSERTQSDVDVEALQSQYDAIKDLDYSGDSGKEANRALVERALRMAQNKQKENFRSGLDVKSASADLGTFQDAYSGFESYFDLQNRYSSRQGDLKTERNERLARSSEEESQQAMALPVDDSEARLKLHEDFEAKRNEISKQYADKATELESMRVSASKEATVQVMASIASSASSTLTALSGMAKEGSTTQKAMLVASRAFHYAQMAMAVESAAAQVSAQGYIAAATAGAQRFPYTPDPGVLATYQALATMTRVMGYTNLAMTAISDVTSSSSDSSSSSSSSSETKKNVTFAGFKDKGGSIGDNEWAIVGEYGPEIVHGPANVTSRADTAAAARSAMNGGNSTKSVALTIAPQITIKTDGSGDQTSAQRQGQITAETIIQITRETISKELEHGGLLNGD